MNEEDPVPAVVISPAHGRSTIHLTLTGLILLCLSLISSTAALTHVLDRHMSPSSETTAATGKTGEAKSPAQTSPWGDLVTIDIDMEQPEEYVSLDTTANQPPVWIFTGFAARQARTLMETSGLTESQINQAFTPGKFEEIAEATTVHPDPDLVLSLSPEVRCKFYTALAQWPANHYMAQPYHLPAGNLETIYTKDGVSTEVVNLVKKLAYSRGTNSYFSDPGLVLHTLSSDDDRLHFLKALTNQPAVFSRLRVSPDTDIDKVLGYWTNAPGVRLKDLRPLLESLKNNPEGGTISMLYLLPPFAREHLYTFPMPGKPGDVRMDCHWSALNFFNEKPDDRFQDNTYASNYIRDHFYEIGKPSMYGDMLFLLNAEGQVIHSAVYIADDIVFTKNGFNIGEPWMLMRIGKLREVYNFAGEPKMMCYRRKEN